MRWTEEWLRHSALGTALRQGAFDEVTEGYVDQHALTTFIRSFPASQRWLPPLAVRVFALGKRFGGLLTDG